MNYSWGDVLTVGERIAARGIGDEDEYQGLWDMCQRSNGYQRAYLYNKLKRCHYSPATLDYLFTTPAEQVNA